jgi:hypothetical protein
MHKNFFECIMYIFVFEANTFAHAIQIHSKNEFQYVNYKNRKI